VFEVEGVGLMRVFSAVIFGGYFVLYLLFRFTDFDRD
jgi:hypothetical protein